MADEVKTEQRKAEIEQRRIDPPDGSYEALIDELREAIEEWAKQQVPDQKYIYVSVQATFTDHVVATIYAGDDYDGVTYSFPYTTGNNGEDVTLGSATQVELVTVIAPADADDEPLGADSRAADGETETPETPAEGDTEADGGEQVTDDGVDKAAEATEEPTKQAELKRKAAALRLTSVTTASGR
jgi:hypothetical protein